ncbi:MAG: PspC domain-containing protein [Lachnospiraceae bacterium]|nr:PspC domain-containing protein [Lachnospiraceae bacterium]
MNNDYRRLERSRTQRMICGVCGGIGEYFNVDPTLIRLAWALLTVGSIGAGIVVYFIAAIIIPDGE